MAASPANVFTLEGRSPPASLAHAAAAFRELRDPNVLYRSDTVRQALDGLAALATDGGCGVGLLTGAPGLGKTLVRTALHAAVAAGRCHVVALETGLLTFDDLLLEVLSQLRGERVASTELPGRYDRLAALKEALATEVAPTGRHLLLVCDDAQQLDDASLDGIGSLMNLASERRALVVPVLVGQPALRQRLSRLPVLRQRIGGHYSLRPLERDECVDYVGHRLRAAGIDDAARAFDDHYLDALHAASGGTPRVINALCRLALAAASERGLPRADGVCLDRSRARLVEPLAMIPTGAGAA